MATKPQDVLRRQYKAKKPSSLRSVVVNSTAQLRVLHAIWPCRQPGPDIMLMAGGGTNNPFPNYSAYCVSKIMLIKMCE